MAQSTGVAADAPAGEAAFMMLRRGDAADTAAFIAFYKNRYENLKVARDLIKEVKSAF